jgi:hypothetical protein
MSSLSRLLSSARRLLATAAILLAAASGVVAAHSMVPAPPPPEVLKLMDLLADGEPGVPQLRAVLQPVIQEQFGTKYLIGYFLREAILRGALREDEVIAALESEGCSRTGDSKFNMCYSLRRAIWPDQGPIRRTKTEGAGPTTQSTRSLESIRAAISAASPKQVVDSGLIVSFTEALVRQGGSPLRRGLELFAISSVDQIPSVEDRAAVRKFSATGDSQEARDMGALDEFRRTIGGIISNIYWYAKPTPEMVAEVRSVPQEVINQAWQTDRKRFVGSALDRSGNLLCVLSAWRKGEQPPNEWLAWKDLLICKGWN